MDLTETITPNSEQVNAEDLLGGERRVTITSVEKGNTEQPVFIHLAEFPGRTYRPAKSMRRLMVHVWGPDSSTYTGRQMVIYNDPEVKWAGQAVGGIRIRAMSHITKPETALLTVSRGKRAPFTVQPLTTPDDATTWLTAASTLQELQDAWSRVQQAGYANNPALVELKNQRKAELSTADG